NTVAFLDPSIRSLRLVFLRLERKRLFEFKFTRFSRPGRDQDHQLLSRPTVCAILTLVSGLADAFCSILRGGRDQVQVKRWFDSISASSGNGRVANGDRAWHALARGKVARRRPASSGRSRRASNSRQRSHGGRARVISADTGESFSSRFSPCLRESAQSGG